MSIPSKFIRIFILKPLWEVKIQLSNKKICEILSLKKTLGVIFKLFILGFSRGNLWFTNYFSRYGFQFLLLPLVLLAWQGEQDTWTSWLKGNRG